MSSIRASSFNTKAARDLDVVRYNMMVILTMACYDYAVTFPREVRLVWRSDMSIAKANFLVNRYALLFWVIVQSLILLPPFTLAEKSCAIAIRIDNAMLLAFFAFSAVFSAIRVFAVSARDWRPTTAAIMLGMVAFVANLVNYSTESVHVREDNIYGCSTTSRLSNAINDKMVIFTRTCSIAADMVCLAALWYYTREHIKAVKIVHDHRSTSKMMLDNGFVYFAVSLPLNILAIMMWLYTSYGDVVTLFVEPISYILISRCLLDLRGTVDPNDDELEPDDVSSDDISFAAWRSSQFQSQIEDTTHSQRSIP